MPLIGVITSKRCPACGHHEVGVTTGDGVFHPLRPGTWIQTLEAPPLHQAGSIETSELPKGLIQDKQIKTNYKPWLPDFLRGKASLRHKYGVMIREDMVSDHINGDLYQVAYLEKVESLIDKEIPADVVVMFDRLFAAPHLVSGNPSEITQNIWRELEEIREPVRLMNAWLTNPGEETLLGLIHPYSKEDLQGSPIHDKRLEEELNELTLEQFLSLL